MRIFSKILLSGLLTASLSGMLACNDSKGSTDDIEDSTGGNDTVGGDEDGTGGEDDSTGGEDDSTGGEDDSTGGEDDSTDGEDDSTDGEDDSTDGEDDSIGGEDDSTGGEDCDVKALVLETLPALNESVSNIPTVTVDESGEGRILSFSVPSGMPTGDPESRLYLDFDSNSFLDISDLEAQSNDDWDIAFDASNFYYVSANSAHSGAYFPPESGWAPQGIMIAKIDDIDSEEDFLAIDGTDRDTIAFAYETWVDEEVCEVVTESVLSVAEVPKGIVGLWYNYSFTDHTTIPTDTAYVVYDSANNHHVYKFRFLSYENSTGTIEIQVVEEFINTPEEPVDEECDVKALVLETLPALEDSYSGLPTVAVTEIDGNDNRILEFSLPNIATPEAPVSRLYLDIDSNSFLSISDLEAQSNNDWDFAFDPNNLFYVSANSSQSGAYFPPESGWAPQGIMVAKIDGIDSEEAFLEIDGTDRDSIAFAYETWVNDEVCEVVTESLGESYDVPKGIVGLWYAVVDDVATTTDTAYVVYNSANNHHVYKFRFVSLDSNGKVELQVVEEFINTPADPDGEGDN